MTDVTRNQTWRRKRNRLAREAYQGSYAFTVTVNTWQRQTAFMEAAEVDKCRGALQTTARDSGFEVLAYCFMPDHLHLVVRGSEESVLSSFMKSFKQLTSFDYKRRTGQPLWQRSYYDHIVRGDDDLEASIDYALANPVVAGLTEDAYSYPFSGGAVLEEELVAT